MKIKISYVIDKEEIIDITPQEFCELRADLNYKDYFPKDSRCKTLSISDEESTDEFYTYLFDRKEK